MSNTRNPEPIMVQATIPGSTRLGTLLTFETGMGHVAVEFGPS